MAANRVYVLRDLKNNRTLRHTIYIFLAVTCTVSMVILFLFTNQMLNSGNDQKQRQAEASIRQIELINNTSISSMSQYMFSRMAESYDISGLLYSSDYTKYLLVNSRKIYEQLANINELILNVQLVNYSTQTVLDQNGRYAFANYGDYELLEFLDTLTSTNRVMVYCYPRTMNTSSSKSEPTNTKVISMVLSMYKAGALVVNYDYEYYKGMALTSAADSSTSYYLCDSNALCYCSTDDSLFAASLADNEIYKRISAASDESGSFTMDNGRTSVTYQKDASMGTCCFAVTENDGLFFGEPIFWQTIGRMIAFLVLSVTISIALAWIINKPIRILHRSVKEKLDADMAMTASDEDEISFLDNMYQNILNANRMLKEKSELYQFEREGQILLNMMNPLLSTEQASSAAIAELETKMGRAIYRVIAYMPDRHCIQVETDVQTIRHSIATTAGEILRTLGSARSVFPPSYQVLFLLNYDYDEDGGQRIGDVISSTLPACIQALNGMNIYLGIGGEVSSLDDLADSYRGAIEAAQYAYVKQLPKCVFASELQFPDLSEQSYAFDLDEQITHAIKHKDETEATQAVQRFFERISEYNHTQYVRNTLHLDVSLQKLELSIQTDCSIDRDLLDASTVNHWNETDACRYFVQRVQEDIAELMNKKMSASPNKDLIDNMDKMIEENVLNPNFSIAQMAGDFSLSVNYLRNLYKAGTGESLSARITRKRVEAACKLLDNSDETIDSITEKLGFSTRNYFFTFFKKHMGMTPTQYRNR